jgi:hypothetical protein
MGCRPAHRVDQALEADIVVLFDWLMSTDLASGVIITGPRSRR